MVTVSEQDESLPISICLYCYLLLFQLPSTQELALAVLANLQQCVRAGLAYESLYWLVYNSITLIFHVARRLMSRAVIDEVCAVVIVHAKIEINHFMVCLIN